MLAHLTLVPQPASTRLRASMDAFLLSRQAMRCTAKTLEHYRYTLGSFIAFLEAQGVSAPDDIKPAHIRAYLVSLQKRGVKDTTQHAHARGIKTWLNWLVAEGDLDTSPMQRVPMPRLEKRIPAPFTVEDVRKLLDACDPKTAIGARNRAIILTALDTGLRASELLSLRVGDLNMKSGLMTVMGKGQKMRQVRVGARARSAILKMLGFREEVHASDPLWLSYDPLTGQPAGALTKRGLQTMLHRLGQRVGVMPCSPHRFRRTFAIAMLRDGCDLHSLRMLMGHSSLDVLQRYLALAGEDVERAHAAHSPADKLFL